MTSLLEHRIILPGNRFLLQCPFLPFSVTVLGKVDQISRMELKKKLKLYNVLQYTLAKVASIVLGSGRNKREKTCDFCMVQTKNRKVFREKWTALSLQLQITSGKVASFLAVFLRNRTDSHKDNKEGSAYRNGDLGGQK